MEVFNNCRLCLQAINHEPIKMTRLIIKFIEQEMHMTNIGRNLEQQTKANLCAACFNKLAELQDFHEQCKEADAFWKTKFPREEDGNSVDSHEHMQEEESEAKLVSEMTSTKTEAHIEEFDEAKEEDDEQVDELLLSLPAPDDDIASTPPRTPLADSSDSESGAKIHNFDTATNLEEWTENEDPVIDLESTSTSPVKYVVDQEIIEFEYELQQENVGERELFITEETPLTIVEEGGCPTEVPNFEYEEVNDDESCDVLIQESFNDAMSNAATEAPEEVETIENTYIVTTTLDDFGKVKKSYQCQHCDRSFDRIYDIESHYNIHSDIKPFKCDVCGRSFRQKNILTTHQALHFGKKVECPECGKKFARRSQLILHFRMHRNEKPFQCDFDDCQAAFRQRQHLIDHSFIHTGEKNFQCSSCTKAFHTRKRLQDHMYKVHSYHRYGCDMCEKAFLKPHMLKNHLSSTHKVEVHDVSHLKTTIDQIKPPKKSNVSM